MQTTLRERIIQHEYVTMYISKNLLNERGKWDKLPDLKKYHKQRMDFLLLMRKEKLSNPVTLRGLAKKVTECEYDLQAVWGFDLDSSMHYWDESPHCKCKKPEINQKCIIHGLAGMLIIEDTKHI